MPHSINLQKWSVAIIMLLTISCKKQPKSILFYTEETTKNSCFYGLNKLKNQLKKTKINLIETQQKNDAQLVINLNENIVKNDGYIINKTGTQTILTANNNRGIIYGLQDISEQITPNNNWKNITTKQTKSHYNFRAIKFNLPWFSYRKGKNLSLHYETCRDLKFWESFLDMMVENKFNVLSLWSLHPYIYMVQPKNFLNASPFTNKEFKEWQAFWKALFKMAKQRGIETYIVNWNIFVSEEFAQAYGAAEYSKDSGFWGEGETNESIEKYTKEIVTQTINEYPNLTGIGITLGERMGGMTSQMRKDWINRTIIAGIKEANREAKLFYRAPLSAGLSSEGTVSKSTEILTREALENIGLKNDVHLGFKFNWSHGHSSPKLSIVHGGILTDTYWKPKPKNYKGIYTVRNEDFFALRWAQPDFIRAFIGNNSQEYIDGTIIGSETYIPAKDYITKNEHRTWNYAFERQWLFYKTWGNLLYNKTTPDTYFENALKKKFSITETNKLLKAWKQASMNANRFASFHQGTWDATIYTEGFTTVGGKFIDINKFINHPVLDSSYVNIKDFVAGNYTKAHITPLKLAETTERESNEAINTAKFLKEKHPENKRLQIELNDIEAWGYFGLYFASKIRGGVALENYRTNNDKEQQKKAIQFLEFGLKQWWHYTNTLNRFNVDTMPHQFNPKFSFSELLNDVQNDILIAKE
ncbi:hypothetical protein FUA26_13430 [Seonamhaeicola algicola]|uniref:Beta-hexosaminidase bacterial type N-terminal domain-containing protein n=1 Tax=Seonamhaeicola algicola TaxID=1719036 RepID=A0A5C7AH42_9FLAO|nr:hypothetical protein [Seonamhaeicola algicola]TXE07219.1 hypothetical protein FUA26_13430 [Seonamhaeicola algicola]